MFKIQNCLKHLDLENCNLFAFCYLLFGIFCFRKFRNKI